MKFKDKVSWLMGRVPKSLFPHLDQISPDGRAISLLKVDIFYAKAFVIHGALGMKTPWMATLQ